MDSGFFPLLSIGGFLYVENNKKIIIAIITINTTLHPCQEASCQQPWTSKMKPRHRQLQTGGTSLTDRSRHATLTDTTRRDTKRRDEEMLRCE
jgi:hypothetical protein